MNDNTISVGSLHALQYCERLFYLEEVERIRIADAAVFSGRRLHEEISSADAGPMERHQLRSPKLGLIGTVDALSNRDGPPIPYEHKRGRSAGTRTERQGWDTDRIQVGAYAMLLEETIGRPVPEGRIRYHADNVTVTVPLDVELRAAVLAAVERARQLKASVERPPVTKNDRRCLRCSLAPACLPEEARLAVDADFEPVRLLPVHPDRLTLHVSAPGAQLSRSGDALVVREVEGEETLVPTADVGQVVLHGLAQITTQAIRLCVDREIGVHWMTSSGGLVGSLTPSAVAAQRHVRQFEALREGAFALAMARRLVTAKVSNELRFLLRATRGKPRGAELAADLHALRELLQRIRTVPDADGLLGVEGAAAAVYFKGMATLIDPEAEGLQWSGRSKRPAQDRLSAVLNYGYGMLYRQVLAAVIGVGLHPGFGFYHRPRSAAQPLALDLMELFRTPVVDMAVVGGINRRSFDPVADFDVQPGQVTLAEVGRRKVIDIIERRLADVWRHDVVGYSLSYARIIELEVRLLEKEWCNEGGLFARVRLR